MWLYITSVISVVFEKVKTIRNHFYCIVLVLGRWIKLHETSFDRTFSHVCLSNKTYCYSATDVVLNLHYTVTYFKDLICSV